MIQLFIVVCGGMETTVGSSLQSSSVMINVPGYASKLLGNSHIVRL